MLWHKGWLETRIRILLAIVGTSALAVLMYAGSRANALQMIPIVIMVPCLMLAGAGLETQDPYGESSKGLYGSTLYTLSMPVSRLRLLAVRSSVGWLEMSAVIGVFCCEMWFILPGLIGAVTPAGMIGEVVTLIICSSTLYFLSVLLGVVFGDFMRTAATAVGFAVLVMLSMGLRLLGHPLPAFMDVLEGMQKRSPIIAHTMPLGVLAFSVGLSAALFFAAVKTAQRREF